jgi:hypothetical protein
MWPNTYKSSTAVVQHGWNLLEIKPVALSLEDPQNALRFEASRRRSRETT